MIYFQFYCVIWEGVLIPILFVCDNGRLMNIRRWGSGNRENINATNLVSWWHFHFQSNLAWYSWFDCFDTGCLCWNGRGLGSKALGHRAWPFGCIRLAPLSWRLALPPPAPALPLCSEVARVRRGAGGGRRGNCRGPTWGAKRGDIRCSRSGMGELKVWCVLYW